MTSRSKPPWYRARSYAHFDRRPTQRQVVAYVMDPAKVAKHGFFPLIMRPVKVQRWKTEGGKRICKLKIRPTAYAAHMDTQIHAFYAWQLREALEPRICSADISDCVLAYRRVEPPKSNIDFAREVFVDICHRRDADVVALDIEGFFDRLHHEQLKAAWQEVLSVDRLPDDHFNVFRSVTQDRAINWVDLRRELKEKYRRRAGPKGDRVCTIDDFRSKLRPFVKWRWQLALLIKDPKATIDPTKGPVGIPQGSAISAVLANVYMFAHDVFLRDQLAALGASYRRYSDDILVIAPPGALAEVEKIIRARLDAAGLKINDGKTERAYFRAADTPTGTLSMRESKDGSGELREGPIGYLGFTFDGRAVRLRSSTIARYLIRMHRCVKRALFATKGKKEFRIKRRQVYAKMSKLGPGDAYGPVPTDKEEKDKYDRRVPRPGFVAYNKRAKRTMAGEALLGETRRAMSVQLERLWEELHLSLKAREAKIPTSYD